MRCLVDTMRTNNWSTCRPYERLLVESVEVGFVAASEVLTVGGTADSLAGTVNTAEVEAAVAPEGMYGPAAQKTADMADMPDRAAVQRFAEGKAANEVGSVVAAVDCTDGRW